jgi:hypothetical protein
LANKQDKLNKLNKPLPKKEEFLNSNKIEDILLCPPQMKNQIRRSTSAAASGCCSQVCQKFKTKSSNGAQTHHKEFSNLDKIEDYRFCQKVQPEVQMGRRVFKLGQDFHITAGLFSRLKNN